MRLAGKAAIITGAGSGIGRGTANLFAREGARVLIAEINRHLAGWREYFKLGYPRRAFRKIDWYARERLIRHLRRRSQRPFRPPEGITWCEQLTRLGLLPL